jgi:hypothetical protein
MIASFRSTGLPQYPQSFSRRSLRFTIGSGSARARSRRVIFIVSHEVLTTASGSGTTADGGYMDEQNKQAYLAMMNVITTGMYSDIQVAKHLAAKAFGADVSPEIVLQVYDRILDRLPQSGDAEEQE